MCYQVRFSCSAEGCLEFAWQYPAVQCVMSLQTGFLCDPDFWYVDWIKDTDPYSLCIACEQERERQYLESMKEQEQEDGSRDNTPAAACGH